MAGVLFLSLAHMTVNIGFLAWLAYTPFLIYLHRATGRWRKVHVLLALMVGWSLVVAKIITPPLIYPFIFMYSVPIALIHFPAFLIWDRFNDFKWGFLLFPAVLTSLEWVQYTFTPLASWGVAAYSQSEYLAVIQSISLFGMPGLSFLIYWVNVAITDLFILETGKIRPIWLPLTILTIIVGFGEIRINFSNAVGKDVIKVATIGTDAVSSGLPLPKKAELESVNQKLFERTSNAASADAKIIVWNEGATFIYPEDEEKWKHALQKLSEDNAIFLFASYIIPTSEDPLKYDNKYLLLGEDGNILYEYHKHQPVPGEPAIKGKEVIKTFQIQGAQVGGAICYDYDFPYLAAKFKKAGADIMAIPSSDWRGIDPIHTEMAAYRAIEQGHSVIRSTRFGLSAAITPYGEMVTRMSSFDNNDKIMLATVPKKGITTLYSLIKDFFIYLNIGFIVLMVGMGVFRPETLKKRSTPTRQQQADANALLVKT
jgi:apolipoprotein N-acyltransferase